MFDRRPDQVLMDFTQNGLEVLQKSITTVTTLIRTGDEGLRSIDGALTGNRSKLGETPSEAFMGVLDMLQGVLEEAREKKSATDATVVQRSREMLTRINDAEPTWKPAPMGMRSLSDVYRAALRDLRGHSSMVRLASGQGSINDLDNLGKWADDLNQRLQGFRDSGNKPKGQKASPRASEGTELAAGSPLMLEEGNSQAPAAKPARRAKKDTTPKTPPNSEAVRYAQLVAEELNDKKVVGWAEEYSTGKISEAQWLSRLTAYCAPKKKSLDDVFNKAADRMIAEKNAKPA
jgi:hypothetical protein